MASIKALGNRLGVAGDLLAFFWARKLWWMLPMIILLLFFGLLIGFAQTSAIAPFIYTLF
jgi:hypothetical protein